MAQYKPESRSPMAWLTQQVLPLCVAVGAIWTLDPQRLVSRNFDIGSFAPAVVQDLHEDPVIEKIYGEDQGAPVCPGADCPLNPRPLSELNSDGWRHVPASLYERVSSTGWRGVYLVRIETTLPSFASASGAKVAFDVLGIAGKSWRLFINGKEKAAGAGGVRDEAVEFLSDGGVAGEPLTIGLEIDAGRTFAPGIISLSQPFLSVPEVAPVFRSAYRGIDKERVLPDAFGRMILAVLAALGCLFTPFHLEILAYAAGLALWNYSRMIGNAMAPFPNFLDVDFSTLDSAVRCGFYACVLAFWPLYFRQRKFKAFVPAILFAALAPACLFAGKTGILNFIVPAIIKNHFGILAVVVLAGAAFASSTWLATRNLPHAIFRRRVAILFAALLTFDATLLFARQLSIWGFEAFPALNGIDLALKVTKVSELVMASFGVVIALEWALVVRDRQMVLQRFGMVIDPRILREIIRSPHLPTIRAERVVCLFVDLRSFSVMCEQFAPSAVNLALNEYLDVVTNAVQANNGIIDKFVGDAVLALWGVPVRSASDAADSIRAAIAIRKGISELNARRVARGEFIVSCGIGIHAGPAIFGPVGNAHRIDFTAIGPTINMAARLQSLTKETGADILISDSLHKLVADKTLCQDLGVMPVRGFAAGAHVLRLLGFADASGGIKFEDPVLALAGLPPRAGLVDSAPRNLVHVDYGAATHDQPTVPVAS
ncbi:adenylate/guanylate cyclase domain-containing protein [bacterium]|nr:adenylate/guanylate cyclase domain-containing protein [bacterium]